MIIRLSYLLLSLLFFAIAIDINYEIDIPRCQEDTVCFVRASCKASPGDKSSLYTIVEETELTDNKCDVVFQIKAYTDKKFLIFLQVEASDNKKLQKENGISISQNNKKITCKETGVTSDEALLEVARHGKRQEFTNDLMFCSFTLATKDKSTAISQIFKDSGYIGAETKIEFDYVGSDPKVPEHISIFHSKLKGGGLWAKAIPKCNPDDVTTGDITNDPNYKLSKVDPVTGDIAKFCGGSKILVKDGAESVKSATLFCDEGQYKYDSGAKIKLEAYCVDDQYCTQCPALTKSAIPQCKDEICADPIMNTDPMDCKTAQCKDKDMWTIDGKNRLPGAEIVCKPSLLTPGTGVWFLKEVGKPEREIKEAACLLNVPCFPENLKTKECNGETGCSTPTVTVDAATCPAGSTLQGKDGPITNGTCDENGKYGGITSNNEVYCLIGGANANAHNGDNKENPAGASIGVIAGCVLGVVIALVAVGAAVYFLVLKPRKAGKKGGLKKKGGKNSKKQSDEQASSTKKDGEKGKSIKSKKSDAVKSDTNKEAEAAATPAAGAEAAATPAAGAEAAATPAAGAAAAATPATPGAVPSNPATDPSKLDKVIEAEKAAGVGAAPSDPPANEQTAVAGAK